jgi:ATP adenylyltransferase/5',5'''-P-1,P-4-tetraphosphate phosphorylase II
MEQQENIENKGNSNSPLGVRGTLGDKTNLVPLQGLGVNSLNLLASNLFSSQLSNWELARTNFAGLKTVRTKSFDFGDFEVKVQFNPARFISSGAKVDAKTIAGRKCFLCTENRPAEQTSVDAGDYLVLVNPFPIFPEHFTIPRKEHVDQQIKPYFADMLELAEALDDYLIFYNGSRCGASAPDHMHFQAGTKDFLPLVNDYKRLKDTHAQLLVESENFQLFNFNGYLRTVYCIESTDVESAKDAFEKLYKHFQQTSPPALSKGEGTEPMLNIVCTFEDGKWFTFVLPRKAFRPWQYTAEGDQQLLVSPATVEMCGIFITPIEAHFEKITKEDVVSILEEVSTQ